MQVVIRNVDVQWSGEGRKKWGKAVVEYTYNGESRKQNVISFSNPEIFKKVQELSGQTVEVETFKNDKGYTEWKTIDVSAGAPSSGASPAATGSTRVSGSNYETREERAARQVLIVKQSSLSNAVAALTPGAKSALDPKVVIDLAQVFTDWVLDTKSAEDDDMGGDLPF
jgi:hypothetical protein